MNAIATVMVNLIVQWYMMSKAKMPLKPAKFMLVPMIKNAIEA